jgi:hypothetical protein
MQDESHPTVKKRGPGKPFEKGDRRAGRPKGRLNETTIEVRQLARELIEDSEYRANLRARLITGECSPPVETMLWHYAYGKPKESIELTGKDAVTNIFIRGVMPIPPELAGDVAPAVGPETTTTAAEYTPVPK